MNLIHILVVGALGTACFGCASTGPVRADLLSRSQAAVHGAEVSGAESVPAAADQLRVARDELAKGRKMVIDGDQDRAEPMLLRAEADAELALNVARQATAVAEAQKTRDEIQNLRMSMKGGN